VAFNDRVIVSGAMDHKVIVWSLETGERLRTFSLSNPVWCVQLEKGTSRALATIEDGGISLLDWALGLILVSPKNPEPHQNAVTFAQFDRYKIVSSSFDKSIKIWNFCI